MSGRGEDLERCVGGGGGGGGDGGLASVLATVKRLGDSPSGKVWKPEINSKGKKNPASLCHIKFTTLKSHYL